MFLSGPDRKLLAFIERAILDSLWAREPSTVRGNLNALKIVLCTMDDFHLPGALPPMGPFPLTDQFGMTQAIITLSRLLGKGKYEHHIQWNTTRKVISAMNNLGQATVGGL